MGDFDKKLAVYVHWPWCKAKCPYCDFNSHAGVPREEEYVAAVCAELRWWREQILPGREIMSVFFGGGTPSLMKPASVRRIFTEIEGLGAGLERAEITVECNPTSSSRELFEGLKAVGVNRVSVGVQGLEAAHLQFLGREHAVGEALATLEAALAVVGNVNADVIYGLPGQDLAGWERLLGRLADMGLPHLSAYQLTIEKNTAFYSAVRRGAWQPIDNDSEADFFETTLRILEAAGYVNYEISNFARKREQGIWACAHNLHVWRYGDYLGVGAGAHGRVRLNNGRRVATTVVRQPEGYLLKNWAKGEMFSDWEVINGARTLQEALFLGLRLREGVDLSKLKKNAFSSDWERALDMAEMEHLLEMGVLVEREGRIQLSREGWAKLDGVLGRILRRLDDSKYEKRPRVLIEPHLN